MALLPIVKRRPIEKQNKKLDSMTSLYIAICLSFSNKIPVGSWELFFPPRENGKPLTSETKLKTEYARFSLEHSICG